MRNLTYASTVLADVRHDIVSADGEVVTSTLYRELPLYEQPIMVGSCKCHTITSSAKEMVVQYNVQLRRRQKVGQLRRGS